MNTCPTCKNDLVCHDQGECLRKTPETDAEERKCHGIGEIMPLMPNLYVSGDFARRLERERNEARAEAARLQMELDASCNAEELRQVREENARLREIAVLCRNVLNDLHQLPTAKQYLDTPCLSREYATAVRISLIKLNQALTP